MTTSPGRCPTNGLGATRTTARIVVVERYADKEAAYAAVHKVGRAEVPAAARSTGAGHHGPFVRGVGHRLRPRGSVIYRPALR